MFGFTDNVDGLITVACGVYLYLISIGKIQIIKDKEKSDRLRGKYGKILELLSPFVIIYGIFTLCKPLLGL